MPSLLDRLPFRRKRDPPLAEAARRVADAAPAVADKAAQVLERARNAPATTAAPVVLLATGAGVAVWWWTQWARGRAESEAAEKKSGPE